MDTLVYAVGAVTNAMRGKSVLERGGVRAFIGRDSDSETGCGYTLTVTGDQQRAQVLLQSAGIRFRVQT